MTDVNMFTGEPAFGYTGLTNLGNTCYMNAQLQSLFMSSQFCRFLLGRTTTQQSLPLSFSLKSVLAKLKAASMFTISPTGILEAIGDDRFSESRQADSSEFLSCLLAHLEVELGLKVSDLVSSSHWFGGQLQHSITCQHCGQCSHQYNKRRISFHEGSNP